MKLALSCGCCVEGLDCFARWVRKDDPREYSLLDPVNVQLLANPLLDIFGPEGVPFAIDGFPTGPLELAGGPTAFGPGGQAGVGYYNVNSNAVRFSRHLTWPEQEIVYHGQSLQTQTPQELNSRDLVVNFSTSESNFCERSASVNTIFIDRYISGHVQVADSSIDSLPYLFVEGDYPDTGGADWKVHGNATPESASPEPGPWLFDAVPVSPRNAAIIHDTIEEREVVLTAMHPDLGLRQRTTVWHKTYNSVVGGQPIRLDEFPLEAVWSKESFDDPSIGELMPATDLIALTDGRPGFYWSEAARGAVRNLDVFSPTVYDLSGTVEEVFVGLGLNGVPATTATSYYLDQLNGVPLQSGDHPDPTIRGVPDGHGLISLFSGVGNTFWPRLSSLDGVSIDVSQPTVGVTTAVFQRHQITTRFTDGIFSAISSPEGIGGSFRVTNTFQPLDIAFQRHDTSDERVSPDVASSLNTVTDTAIFPPGADGPVGIVSPDRLRPFSDESAYLFRLVLEDTWAVYADPFTNQNLATNERVSDHFDTLDEALAESEEIHGPFDPAGFTSPRSFVRSTSLLFEVDLESQFPELNFDDDLKASYVRFEYQWVDDFANQFPQLITPRPPVPDEIFEVRDFTAGTSSAYILSNFLTSLPVPGGTELFGRQPVVLGGVHRLPTFLGNILVRPEFRLQNRFSSTNSTRLHQKLNFFDGALQVSDAAPIVWESDEVRRRDLRRSGEHIVDLSTDNVETTQSILVGVFTGSGHRNIISSHNLPTIISNFPVSQAETVTTDICHVYTPDTLQLVSDRTPPSDLELSITVVGVFVAGESVQVTYTITNNTNEPLFGFLISDPDGLLTESEIRAQAGQDFDDSETDEPVASGFDILAGTSESVTIDVVITQSDITAGSRTFSATGSASKNLPNFTFEEITTDVVTLVFD